MKSSKKKSSLTKPENSILIIKIEASESLKQGNIPTKIFIDRAVTSVS